MTEQRHTQTLRLFVVRKEVDVIEVLLALVADQVRRLETQLRYAAAQF